MAQELTIATNTFDYWLKRNWYYHKLLINFYRFVVPRDVRVLQLGCTSGYILHAVEPSYGIGVESDEQLRAQAQARYRNLTFIADIDELAQETFDYIILSSITMEVEDIQIFLEQLSKFCHTGTRIVIDTYGYLWEPILVLAQKLGLRRPTTVKHWLSQADLVNFLHLADLEVVTKGSQILLPVYIPGLSWFINTFVVQIPFIERLCLSKWIIARPLLRLRQARDFSVSVVVTVRNERGNIEAAVQRCPSMGKHTEMIFVEGHSRDGSLKEIQRIVAAYPECDISWYVQDGIGKGDAVRKGFAHAKGDALMILDGDLTTPPEELPKFFDALVRNKGEFINGSRLVYGMESRAMRFLNFLANHGFALGFSWLLGQRIKDTLCGTKVLFKTDYEKIVKNRSYFGDFDPFGDFDLLFGAAKLNLKIIDMPVHYKDRTYGTSQISRFKHGMLLLHMSIIAWKKFKFRT